MPRGTREWFLNTVLKELTVPLHQALAERVQTCDRESESVASLEFIQEWCQAHVPPFVVKHKARHCRDLKIQGSTTCQHCSANKARAKVRLTEQPPRRCPKHQGQDLCLVEMCIVTHKNAHAISKPAPDWIHKSGSDRAAKVHPKVLEEVKSLLKTAEDCKLARICNACYCKLKPNPDKLLRALLKGLRLRALMRRAFAALRRRVHRRWREARAQPPPRAPRARPARRRRGLRAQPATRAPRARHRPVAEPTSPATLRRDTDTLPPTVPRPPAVVLADPQSPTNLPHALFKDASVELDDLLAPSDAATSPVPPQAVLGGDAAHSLDMTFNSGHAGWPGYHPAGCSNEDLLLHNHLHALYAPAAQLPQATGQFADADMGDFLASIFPCSHDVLSAHQDPRAANVCERMPPHALPAHLDTELGTGDDPFSDDGYDYVALV